MQQLVFQHSYLKLNNHSVVILNTPSSDLEKPKPYFLSETRLRGMIIKFKVDQCLSYFVKCGQNSNREIARQFLKIETKEEDSKQTGNQEAGRDLLEKLQSIGVSSESYFLMTIAGITSTQNVLWGTSLKMIE